MKTEYRDSFVKDLKAIKDKGLLKRIKEAIDVIENAESLADLTNLEKAKS